MYIHIFIHTCIYVYAFTPMYVRVETCATPSADAAPPPPPHAPPPHPAPDSGFGN